MNRTTLIGVVIVIVAAAGVIGYLVYASSPQGKRFSLEAREFAFIGEGFSGATGGPTLRVKAGDTVTVAVTNRGGIAHEFMIVEKQEHEEMVAKKGDMEAHPNPAFGSMIELDPGQSKTITFTAVTPGEFVYACYEETPQLHAGLGMFSRFIVER